MSNPDNFIQFHNDEERALFTEAKLGQEAINFLASDLGRFLQGCAQADIDDAKEALITVDCRQYEAIENLQFQARVANQFIGWIGEAIQNGHYAEQQLDQLNDDEDND